MNNFNIAIALVFLGLLITLFGFYYLIKSESFSSDRMIKAGALVGIGSAVAIGYSGYFFGFVAFGIIVLEILALAGLLYFKEKSRSKALLLQPVLTVLSAGILWLGLFKMAPFGI